MKSLNERLTGQQRALIIKALEHLNCILVYLFGSYGSPLEHPASDIDIAFLPSFPVGPIECFDFANTLAELLGRSVDLIDLSSASTVMAKEVIRTGVVLHVADQSRLQQFEMRTLADYARLNEERQPVLAMQ
ncbi:MAG: nucleotidyltransferase domain-containing protein [Verrucomicrobiota bacterium]